MVQRHIYGVGVNWVMVVLILLGMGQASVNAVDTRVLVDFGPNDTINGNITTSPDKNGNYWNNLVDHAVTADSVPLVDNKNNTTGAYLYVVSEDLRSNGIKNGGLLAPEDSLLNDFAIATATQDYFFTASKGTIGIRGLDANDKFIFSFFSY